MSRPIRGNEHESSWPPLEGSADKSPCFINRETGKVEPGRPKPPVIFDRAPAYHSDALAKPFYHHGACKMVESKSELRNIDSNLGTITTDRMQKASLDQRLKNRREAEQDIREAMHKSIAQLDEGNAPLTEETRQLCERQNEILAEALPGLDPFNATGKVTNAKGRRWKEKQRNHQRQRRARQRAAG